MNRWTIFPEWEFYLLKKNIFEYVNKTYLNET